MCKLVLLFLLAIETVRNTGATCNVCKDGTACISSTEFLACFNNVPNSTFKFECAEGQICSTSTLRCRPKDGASLSCGDESNCGVCNNVDDGKYSCTSRTSYTMCFGRVNSKIIQYCPEAQHCYNDKAKSGTPCSRICLNNLNEQCDRDFDPESTPSMPLSTSPSTLPSTPPSTQPPPSSPEPITPNKLCLSQPVAGRYPNPNDTTCRTYVNCYWKSSALQGTEKQCPIDLWFDAIERICGTPKPRNCD